jgi:hypothetical protein
MDRATHPLLQPDLCRDAPVDGQAASARAVAACKAAKTSRAT